jgi:hypothetical protein
MHEYYQHRQVAYDEDLVARQNTQAMGAIDAALGIG